MGILIHFLCYLYEQVPLTENLGSSFPEILYINLLIRRFSLCKPLLRR